MMSFLPRLPNSARLRGLPDSPLSAASCVRMCCALGLLLALASDPAVMAQGCSPGQLGNPCAQGDVAVQGALTPEANLGLGNPVHLATGNKYLFETDLPASDESAWLTLTRHYNSLDPRQGPLGRGWTLNYDSRLYQVGERVQIVQADGSRVIFPAPAMDTSVRTARGHLRRNTDGWHWIWPDGRQLGFDRLGRLTFVRPAVPRHGGIDIHRHATGLLGGHIAWLADDTGRRVHLHYRIAAGQAYLDKVEAPEGHWRYHYASAGKGQGLRLHAVQHPDGRQRRYLYESAGQSGNSSLPTGIEQAWGRTPPERVRAWQYDAQGRVVSAWQRGPAGPASPADRSAVPPGQAMTLRYGRRPAAASAQRTYVETPEGRRLALDIQRVEGRYKTMAATLSLTHGTEARPEGWPGLTIQYDEQGRRVRWHSPLTGTKTLDYDAQGRLAHVSASDGRHWQYHYDARHRLQEILAVHEKGHASQVARRQRIRLHWHQNRLTRVEHPAEQETLMHDAAGQLIQRLIERPSLPNTGQRALRYQEGFAYDARGRLTTHHLPEGGSLHYHWSSGRHLVRLDWHDRLGRIHTVLRALPGLPGYQHGNGLHTVSGRQGPETFAMAVMDGDQPVWVHMRRHDTLGRVTHVADWHQPHFAGRGWRLQHDGASRLVHAAPVILPPPHQPSLLSSTIAYSGPGPRSDGYWYAWHSHGGLAVRRHRDLTYRPRIERDAAGLPHRVDSQRLHYDPTGRLARVENDQGQVAVYTHNAHGYRTSAWHGRLQPAVSTPVPPMTAHMGGTQYLYVGHRLVAQIDARSPATQQPRHAGTPDPASAPETLTARDVTRRYVYAGQALVGLIDYDHTAPQGQLYAVHGDPLGTPKLVTDGRRRMRWLADYSPTGELLHQWGDLDLAMRLPGQIADSLTGWHDNLLRTYAPAMGAYLEPDPLGPLPDQQALGYARQQPLRHADPTGLILFAFDGTRQSAATRANVWKMGQRYADGIVHYHAGPGNPYYMDNDALVASRADDILAVQWQRLLDTLLAAPAGQTNTIDLIGYSRGAALARHFGNLIASKTTNGLFRHDVPGQGPLLACFDLRFLGLFDTVAQFGLNGALDHLYNYSISPQWTRVAHAVALHEYRSWFPLTSLTGNLWPGVVEAPFIGAHANIGGGLGTFTGLGIPPSPGDLANASLNWMLWQARIAGVGWTAGPEADRTVTEPVLHDYRPALLRQLGDGDRSVHDAGGGPLAAEQGVLLAIGARHRQATEAFIRRFDDWRSREGTAVGDIDMAEYVQWLASVHDWPGAPDMR